ncbi:hypothetical protein Hanom_Chr00s000280g01633341 [Helianthus anomalus]
MSPIMLFKNMATNKKATYPTPIFFGGWIARVYKAYATRTPLRFTMGVGITWADVSLYQSLNLIVDCNNGMIHFKDNKDRTWSPNDPNQVLAIEDDPNRPPRSSYGFCNNPTFKIVTCDL